MKQLKANYAGAQTTWNDPLIEAHEQIGGHCVEPQNHVRSAPASISSSNPIHCRSQETMEPMSLCGVASYWWMSGWVEASPELINDYYRTIVAVSVSAKCRKNEIRNMLPTLVFGINENYDSPIVGTEKVYTNVIYYVISVQASIRNLLWFCETMRKTSYPDRILYSRDLIFARACTIVFVDLSYIIVFVPFAMLHDCFCRFSKIVPRRKSIEKRVGMKILWTRISK